jgi:D-3-phosphoglycerate dehydrogenase
MADIAIVDSPSREIDRGTFKENIDGYSVDRLTMQSGNISAGISEEWDLSEYRAIYVRVGEVTEDVLRRAENLELVCTCGSGYDHIDVEAATDRGVIVTHTPEAPAVGVVEHTFGVIFSMLHRLPEMFEQTANGNWEEGQITVGELAGKRFGVIGLGTIGTKIATMAQQQFGADVIAYDPHVSGELTSPIYPRISAEEVRSRGIELADKQTVLESADVVSLHVPLTERTRNMISEEELAALQRGYLVNTSRGEVVDEDALLDAVERGQLAGAALDVMRTEPPEPLNGLLSNPNVYITPHIAGGTEGYAERSAGINADRIQKVLDGEEPDDVVNPGVLET